MNPDKTPDPRKVLVAGAGGFIGHHLVRRLKREGFWVRGADIKYPEFQPTAADEFVLADLRVPENCDRAVRGVQDVYQLAADMGGIGYISERHARLSRNNVLINANMLEASTLEGVNRYLFTSSACVYPSFLQRAEDSVALRETDSIPADPEEGYGWEKLFSEQLASYYQRDMGLDVRVIRFHNIYGPFGVYEGGREKAPAAICRKVAEAPDGSPIEVWGDGQQTRSFCYIDDCVEGIRRLMDSGFSRPINIGKDEMISVDALVDLVCNIAGKRLTKQHHPSKPQGVRGRNSDNTLLRSVLGWEPRVDLRSGLSMTYGWIWSQLERLGRAKPPAPAPSSAIEAGSMDRAAQAPFASLHAGRALPASPEGLAENLSRSNSIRNDQSSQSTSP
jgi:GDP-D-mannose 3', 5'-epimerase